MVFKMLTFTVDEEDEVFNFRPGSPPYMGPSSSSSSASSPDRACSSCIGGIITQRFSSPTYPSQVMQLQHNASQGGEVEIQRIIKFSVSSTTTLIIQKGDITKWFVNRCSDAIVNATNELMFGQVGVHGELPDQNSMKLVVCSQGTARISVVLPDKQELLYCDYSGYKLRASRIIHTVGPMYGASIGPQALLESAYRSSLSVAKEHNIQYIAFPAVSCGERGYPYDEAANIAISTIKKNSHGLKEVHFVLFLDEVFDVWCDIAKKLLQK